MYKWIIENEIAVGNSLTENEIKEIRNTGVRAIISVTGDKIPEKWKLGDMEYRSFHFKESAMPDVFNLREFLLYAAFLKKAHFPFSIYSKKSVSKGLFFVALYLVYTGKTLDEAKNLIGKMGIFLSAKQESFLQQFNKSIDLYYLNDELKAFYNFNGLIKLLRRQCPWDREQTHISLVPELIEEPLELAEAIKKNDFEGIQEELGDVLLQVVLHSEIAEGEGKFSIKDVMNAIFEKMYRRHPHVFGKANVKRSKDVLKQWEKIKKEEKKGSPVDIAKVLAALITAFDIQEDARKEGFDFSNRHQIEGKIEEEFVEVKEALNKKENVPEEIGDLLFSVINLARFLHIDPAHSLFLSMDKFRKRFDKVKEKSNGRLKEISEHEKDELWNEAKKNI